tara:strand:- start:1291 stop:1473 length:183 start_codon:yes stop_codon:yes gene_type:complete
MVSLHAAGVASVKHYQLRVIIAPFVTAGIVDSLHLALEGGQMLVAQAAVPLKDTVSFGFI